MADNDEGNGAENEEFTDDLDVDDGALEQTNKQQTNKQAPAPWRQRDTPCGGRRDRDFSRSLCGALVSHCGHV